MEYRLVNGEYEKGNLFATLAESRIEGNYLKAKVACPVSGAEWLGFVFSYNYRIEAEMEDRFVEAASIREAGRNIEMELSLDLREFPFKMTHWSICVVYRKNGREYCAGI